MQGRDTNLPLAIFHHHPCNNRPLTLRHILCLYLHLASDMEQILQGPMSTSASSVEKLKAC